MKICKNKSKQKIGKELKKLKKLAEEAENSKSTQAFLIINIGHMLNPRTHRDLMKELDQSYSSNFKQTEYFRDY